MNYKIEKLDLETLSAEEKKKYAIFIPPKIRCTLEGIDPDDISFTQIIAIKLEFNGKPAGIAILGNYEGTGLAEIFSIKIKQEHQKIDLAREMLKQIGLEAAKAGAVILTFYFRKTELDSPFIENVLKQCEWSEPELFAIRYFFDGHTFHPPWYNHPPKLPSKYKLFPWKILKQSEREQLEKEYNQGVYSDTVYPFQKEESIEYSNSLGLRYKDEVIGWSITNRIAPDTIKYSALYVKPEFQFLGYPIRLLVESTKLQQKTTIRWALFEINLERVDQSWIKFVQKRLAPYAIEIDNIYHSWKATSPDVFNLDGII